MTSKELSARFAELCGQEDTLKEENISRKEKIQEYEAAKEQEEANIQICESALQETQRETSVSKRLSQRMGSRRFKEGSVRP